MKYAVAKGKAKTLTLTLGLDGKNLVKRKPHAGGDARPQARRRQVGDEEPHAAARLSRGYFSSRERRRSLSTLPPVCSAGQ